MSYIVLLAVALSVVYCACMGIGAVQVLCGRGEEES